MAGDWIKLRVGLEHDPIVWQIAQACDMSIAEVLFNLYRVTCWIYEHGKYGNVESQFRDSLDHVFQGPLCEQLEAVGWLHEEHGYVMLSGFTQAHRERKSLGSKVRSEVLSAGKCRVCKSTKELQVDHDIPVSRGGSSDIDNLICLCRACNSKKGTRTFAEFVRDREDQA